MERKTVRINRLDCWHSNELIYQANGEADESLYVYVHFRGGRLSVWAGPVPFNDAPADCGEWVIEAEPHHEGRPETITRAILAGWTKGRIEWPDRIEGYHNEAESR